MSKTRQTVINSAVDNFFKSNNSYKEPYDYDSIAGALLKAINQAISADNASQTHEKWRTLQDLTPNEVGNMLSNLFIVKKISLLEMDNVSHDDSAILSVYQKDGENKGVYTVSEVWFKQLIYNASCKKFNTKDIKECKAVLETISETVVPTRDKNLIAVHNGIYDRNQNKLLDFSPDYIFLNKSPIDFNPNATNIVLHNKQDGTDWDIESWIEELSDDEGVPQLLWEIISASIRPNQRWDKAVWFYSQAGNNGKGTLCSLIRNIVGQSNCASITVADFSKDFMLSPLISASIVLTDENDVNHYIDKSANYKAAVTGDPIMINRKYETPVMISYSGMIIQCMNGLPKTKDKSGSFYRRLCLVPFKKSFTGCERKYIKHDYLRNKDVLEYALKKALEMDFDELSEPGAVADAFNDYRSYNNTVMQFWEEIENELQWSKLPINFLYDMYVAWSCRYSPEGKAVSKTAFKDDLKMLLKTDPVWELKLNRTDKLRADKTMRSTPEPLILEYDLKKWFNPNYIGHNKSQYLNNTPFPATFQGICRK